MIKTGINASSGIAIGKAFIYQRTKVQIDKRSSDAVKEKERLAKALASSKAQLQKIYDKALKEIGEEDAAIFEAHLMMLEDPELLEGIEAEIEGSQCNAEWAVSRTIQSFAAMFAAMEDAYFAARAADMRDVGNRIINNLTGTQVVDLSLLDENVILIAEDLMPSDTAQMDKKHVLGFATDVGSRTSHTAIMARSLEIPAVLGLNDISHSVSNGEMMILDGLKGQVIIAPTEAELSTYLQQKKDYELWKKELDALKNLPAETLDGHRVEIAGNIGNPDDAEAVIRNGGEGIGLYRTEFLYMNSDTMPDEKEQFEAYKKVAESFPDGSVIIRTMDIGGDKKLPYLPMDEEMNPFLGLRAVRLSFAREDLFKTQIRAILKASAYGKVYMMFPMISGIQEIRQAKALVRTCMAELEKEDSAFDHDIKIGIMIEVPAAAIMADVLIKEVDFFSIGTNDLCQYTIAVDRMNQKVAYLYDPLNPAVLRLIKNVIDAADGRPGCFTGMCGEMAGDPRTTLILLGLGLCEFSMSAASIPQIKKIIRSVSYGDAREIAAQALQLESGFEVAELVQNAMVEMGLNRYFS